MCGRFTYKLTWPELMRLYRLTLDAPGRNPQPRYNICPTDTIDAVIEQEGKRQLVPMRWGLVPSWWPKPLKELKLATFNACAALERGHRHISRPNKKAPPRSSAPP